MMRPLILAVVFAAAAGCSSDGGAPAASARRTTCQMDSTVADRVPMPDGLEATTAETLPMESPGAADLTMSLFRLGSPDDPDREVAVFWYTTPRQGSMITATDRVIEIDKTVGPQQLFGVNIESGGTLRASVISRDVPKEQLRQLAENATVEGMTEVNFAGHDGELTASLSPSDVPGTGSMPVSLARPDGFIASYTNNETRGPDDDQRAVTIAQFCAGKTDVGRVKALTWWYGTEPVVDADAEGTVATFSYEAPAGNGKASLRLWETGKRTTLVGTFGLADAETSTVLNNFGKELTS